MDKHGKVDPHGRISSCLRVAHMNGTSRTGEFCIRPFFVDASSDTLCFDDVHSYRFRS